MIEIAVLSNEELRKLIKLRRKLFLVYPLFAHAFASSNRVFGFSGYFEVLEKRKLILSQFIASCSGLCSIQESKTFGRLLHNSAASCGWKSNVKGLDFESYSLDDYTITLLQIPDDIYETQIHVILSYNENTKNFFNTLFEMVEKLLKDLKQRKVASYTQDSIKNDETVPVVKELTIEGLAKMLIEKTAAAVYTGAGVSRSSGIPTFVGEGSLEIEFPLIEEFPGKVVEWMLGNPKELVSILGRFQSTFITAKPGPVHIGLSQLEKMGILSYIISSNFDILHQLAGSQKVYSSNDYARLTQETFLHNTLNTEILLVMGISNDEDRIIDFFRSLGSEIVAIDIRKPLYLKTGEGFVKEYAENCVPSLLGNLNKAEPKFYSKNYDTYAKKKFLLLFRNLILAVNSNTTNRQSSLHGEHHWQCVAWIASHLANEVIYCDPLVILIFSIIHDSMRRNEGQDPEHGMRASDFAKSLNGYLYELTPYEMSLVQTACFNHNRGYTTQEPTIGVCWDSDRLNLWRCDIKPEIQDLSTAAGRNPKRIEWAKDIHEKQFDWNTIITKFYMLNKRYHKICN
jgi:uncharacterized protein